MKNCICSFSAIHSCRFLISTVVGLAFLMSFDFIVHNIILTDLYESTANLWRKPEAMIMSWMVINNILKVSICAFIFTQNYKGTGIMEGLRFGLLIGALMSVLMSACYAWMPIPLSLAMAWAASGIVTGLGLGIIFAVLYKHPLQKTLM